MLADAQQRRQDPQLSSLGLSRRPQCRKDLQRNAWRRRLRPLNAAPPPGDDPHLSPDILVHDEEVYRLRLALLDLRREEKEVYLLRQNGDLTYEQIAKVCRRPVGTIKTQMRAALLKLRKVLHGT